MTEPEITRKVERAYGMDEKGNDLTGWWRVECSVEGLLREAWARTEADAHEVAGGLEAALVHEIAAAKRGAP